MHAASGRDGSAAAADRTPGGEVSASRAALSESPLPTVALVTIGQAPRTDLAGEFAALLPPCTIVQTGALDGLDAAQIAAMAPRPGEHALTSRLADGGYAVFGHDQVMPLVQQAIDRAEAQGADVSVVVCSGSFPPMRHRRPLLFCEPLAHHASGGLAAGGRIGVIRPLAEQCDDARSAWQHSLGRAPAAVGAASPYAAGPAELADAVAGVAPHCDLIVLDCIGYDEAMRRVALRAAGKPVLLVRSLAARLVGEFLAR